MTKYIVWSIKFYQRVSRAVFPPACRFYPSCSHYAIEALEKHGIFHGILLSAYRLIRCSPVSKGGYDPVK